MSIVIGPSDVRKVSVYFFARAMPGGGDYNTEMRESQFVGQLVIVLTAGVILPVYRMVPSSSLMARCHGMDFGVDVGVGNSFDTALVCLFCCPGEGHKLLG